MEQLNTLTLAQLKDMLQSPPTEDEIKKEMKRKHENLCVLSWLGFSKRDLKWEAAAWFQIDLEDWDFTNEQLELMFETLEYDVNEGDNDYNAAENYPAFYACIKNKDKFR